jgi:syntaxin 1B/2/3
MMEDLSDLVKLQGEKLLTIEAALEGAHDHVVKGDEKLESGKKYHKKSQKKMCCIMMLLLVIVGVIVIPIVITQVG